MTDYLEYWPGDGDDVKQLIVPLSEYSDEELLKRADELLHRPPSFGDPTNNVWAMGMISLELNRRLYQDVTEQTDE